MTQGIYGHEILSIEDRYLQLAKEAFPRIFALGVVGMSPVDLFPFRKLFVYHSKEFTHPIYALQVRNMPLWFPGVGSLLSRAKEARVWMDRVIDEPYDHVKSQRVSANIYIPCLSGLTR